MTQSVELPLWLFALIVLFAAVTFASHFLFPSVRWFLRRRLEKAVSRLNERLTRPIEPFKLAKRTDMIQRLVYDPEVNRAIVDHARRNNLREDVSFEQARRYAREIVPSFSAFAYFGFGIRAARGLANALYHVRTGPQNDATIAGIPADATVVFIMNHRSNMDYVLVTYLAAGASALSYAVGEWAQVWPLSRLFKSMGAFFIRRKSRGQLYRRVLARYVQLATEGGVTQAIFPEGGLSLDGNLAPPKMGLLTYVVEAGQHSDRDLVFVPVAINYDRVLEDRVLIAAHARGDRHFGARISLVIKFVLGKMWLRLRGRFHKFGSAAVMFGDPLSLKTFGSDRPIADLAGELMHRIEAAMPHMTVPLLAELILNADGAISLVDLQNQAKERIAAGPERFLMATDETPEDLVRAALDHLLERELLAQTGDKVEAKVKPVLEFYARSIQPTVRVAAAAK